MSEVVYFSVDVEASGVVPGLYNLVSIGAVPVGRSDGAWRVEEERFYVELKPIAAGFDPQAMAVHGIPRERLETQGAPADEAMRGLTRFVEKRLARDGGRPVFVGHNAVFDWAYISYYYEFFHQPNPFGYKALDIKSLAMGRLGIGWFETSKETLEKLLPSIPPQDFALAHRADYDALYQAHILCALLNPPDRAGADRRTEVG
ncbi:MAG TPA: 3'-5' exonuclease [Candidatus Polarisedimenticolia bacterium]|nr:3'-5' exonuclease [Candidatus Polarisedimenticolia bacterium]